MRYILIFLCFLLFNETIYGGVIPSNANKKRKVYIISVGFTPPDNNQKADIGYYNVCHTCISDATGIVDYFKSIDKRKARNIDSVIAYSFTKDITLDTLYNAFNNVQRQITKEDIFIFYYASIAWGIQTNPDGLQEGYYLINSKRVQNPAGDNYAFTMRQIKMLTDRISAQRQMLVIDTGNGDVILPDYYRNFFSDNIAEALFSRKNRVIFCPEKYSGESRDPRTNTLKGDIFKAISMLPDSLNILTVFDTVHRNEYKHFMQTWYNNQEGLMANIKVIHELEYLSMLSALKSNNSDGKRGLTIKTKTVTADSSITTRKKKVLIVATSEYAAPSWTVLQNPVNDGDAAAKAFHSLGYEVTTLYNKPKDSILSAISELIDNEVPNPYSQYIIYFAGHGYYDPRQKAGYIVCSDSRQMKDVGRPTMTELNTYIDYTVLFRNLDQLNKVILITDVCFGGTSVNSLLQATREADPKGEADKLKNPFKKVLASGIKEVDDFVRLHNGSISSNSPFAAALISILQKEGTSLSFEELYAKLKSNKELNPTPIESSFGTEKIPNSFSF